MRTDSPRILALTALLAGAASVVRAQEMPNPQMMQMQMQRIAQERPPEAEAAAREFLRRITMSRIGAGRVFYVGPGSPGQPLYVVDGVVMSDAGTGRTLSANDIDNVQVLKGAPALSLFGAKASSGVIIIETKKGATEVSGVDSLKSSSGSFVSLNDSLKTTLAALDSLKTASLDTYWQEVAQLMVQRAMATEIGRRDSVRGQAMEQMFGVEFAARGLQRRFSTVSDAERVRIRSRLEQLMTQHFDVETQLMEREIADASLRLSLVKAELAKRSETRTQRVRSTVEDILRDALRPDAGGRQTNVRVF